MKGILITQCVQNDFVRPLRADESLPNLVHVGRFEADRLAGPNGVLIPFLRAAHAAKDLAIIHVVDQHDPVRHKAHFDLFRPHCVVGSEGAKLIASIDALANDDPDTRLVPAGDLNDFEDSALMRTLTDLGATPDTPIGVIGVWTDAKVAFLLYDLRTRFKAKKLATCSGLTASRSMDAHFRALESLKIVLDVELHHSPASFLAWLDPQAPPPALAPAAQCEFTKAIGTPSWWTPAHVAERDSLIGAIAGSKVQLQPLGGGFSGAQVFIARTTGPARVVKVGARDEIARERFGNERVARVLGDVVPRLLQYREGPRLAAMEMELAQSSDPRASTPATFQWLAQSDPSDEMAAVLDTALELAMDRALGRLYRVAEKDNADLLTTFGFTDNYGKPQFVDSVCRHAETVAKATDGTAAAAGVVAFYRQWLPGRTMMREVFTAPVHADFNLQNLLLSCRPGEAAPAHVWLIDFARLTRLPNLTDFAKVENDLSYIVLPASENAARMQEARLASASLEIDLAPFAVTPEERRYARWMATLRRVAARMDPRGAPAMADYRVALLRYAAHTIGFDEPTMAQRGLALLACARLAAMISSNS